MCFSTVERAALAEESTTCQDIKNASWGRFVTCLESVCKAGRLQTCPTSPLSLRGCDAPYARRRISLDWRKANSALRKPSISSLLRVWSQAPIQ